MCRLLERQVVFVIPGQEIGRGGRRRRGYGGSRGCCARCGGSCIYTFHLPGTDAVKPSVLPLAGIDVKRNRQHFVHLDVELGDFVGTEYFETHSPGILSVHSVFDDKLLYFPFIAGCLGNSASGLEYSDDFTSKFHFVFI